MFQGRSLTDLAKELERQSAAKYDYVADTRKLEMSSGGEGKPPVMVIEGKGTFGINGHAHGQLAAHLNIPLRFYERLKEDYPNRHRDIVNAILQQEHSKRLVRVLDGNVRAFLSDRFRVVDNSHVANVVLPAVFDSGQDVNVASCEVTERKMYLKFTFPRVRAEVVKGDIVEAGLVVTNSEIGAGAVSVAPFINRLVCINGMVMNLLAAASRHVGGRLTEKDELASLLSAEAIEAGNRAFLLKVRDVVMATINAEQFQGIVDKFRIAANQQLEVNPDRAVEAVAERFTLTEGERGNVLNYLARGGDMSRWGLANAVTRASQDAPNYDRATELETVGGQVIELPDTEWRRIAYAA